MSQVLFSALIEKVPFHERDELKVMFASKAFEVFCLEHMKMFLEDLPQLSAEQEDFHTRYRELQSGYNLWREMQEFSLETRKSLEELKELD